MSVSESESSQQEGECVMEWNTQELQRDFIVEGFLAPYVVVKRRSDGVRGVLEFDHSPRRYFNWQEDN